MIRTQLQTERLRLRLFTLADVQIMFELNSDPEIIKYAEATPARDLQEARQRLEQGPLADYEQYGYGRFAVELKETGNVIGFCGIKYFSLNSSAVIVACSMGICRLKSQIPSLFEFVVGVSVFSAVAIISNS